MELLTSKDYPQAVAFNQEQILVYTGRLSQRLANGFSLTCLGGTRTEDEITVIDRTIDSNLHDLLREAAILKFQHPDPLRLAFELAKKVHDRMESPVGEEEDITKILSFNNPRPYSNPVYSGINLIGDFSYEGKKHGVCRHQSLLFKVLADEVDLDVTLRMGYRDKRYGHAWNELVLDNEDLIVDTRRRVFGDYSSFILRGGFPNKSSFAGKRYEQYRWTIRQSIGKSFRNLT